MKLQIAFDDISSGAMLNLLDICKEFVHIAEVGTPMIIEEGLSPVRKIRQAFPDLEILADTKIIDGGYYEARSAFQAGANYATVLGMADLLTIEACLDAAKELGGTIVVDMICVTNLPRRIEQLEELGVTSLAVHVGVDQQAAGRTPLDDLAVMKMHSRKSRIFVAGGITPKTIHHYRELGADVAIVGGGVRHSDTPREAARLLFATCCAREQ